MVLGLALAWIVSLVHLTGLRQSSLFQNVSTAVKVVLIAGFIVAGFAFGTPQPISFAPSAQDLGYILSAPFAISLVFVMYSYSGWNAATYIINEVRDPERTLPRSLLTATLVVIGTNRGRTIEAERQPPPGSGEQSSYPKSRTRRGCRMR